jgi:hypothetical protein
MASATSSGKKLLSTNFFPLSISHFIFHKKMPKTSSKKTAYRWTTPAEETFLSVLAEAVKMGLRRKSTLFRGKCNLSPRHLPYGRL